MGGVGCVLPFSRSCFSALLASVEVLSRARFSWGERRRNSDPDLFSNNRVKYIFVVETSLMSGILML